MIPIDLHFDFEFYGGAVLSMEIDGKSYKFAATYVGVNPLDSLIDTLWRMSNVDENGESRTYNLFWQNEPWGHAVKLFRHNNELRIIIMYYTTLIRDYLFSFEDAKLVLDVTTDFDDFTKKVCRATIEALRKYGFVGYVDSWGDGDDFPILHLLYLLGSHSHKDNKVYFSNFEDEIKMITQIIT